MSITLSPAKVRYLEKVRAELADIPGEEREEVIQDLEAHLAELDDSRIVEELGDPDAFAAEFRTSAGLAFMTHPPMIALASKRLRGHLDDASTRLASLTRWSTVRPIWIVVRGWLLVSIIASQIETIPFRNFPVPSIGDSAFLGTLIVVGATWLSIWVDRAPRTEVRGALSAAYSAVGGLVLLTAVLTPMPLTHWEGQGIDEQDLYFDRLTTADGNSVNNIHAYDIEGNPVDVLLFDGEGRPLLNLPTFVYEEAELNPRASEIHYDNGAVRFERDTFGRIIPNLYPLQLLVHDDFGQLIPAVPPSLGSGDGADPDRGTASDDSSPVTTITPGQ